MKKGTFFKFSASIMLAGAFVAVYQHNQIVKLLYQRRRIEMKKELLVKDMASIQVQLCQLCDYAATKSFACHQLGMAPLKFDQVVTFTAVRSSGQAMRCHGLKS
jgi:hypothetical protein